MSIRRGGLHYQRAFPIKDNGDEAAFREAYRYLMDIKKIPMGKGGRRQRGEKPQGYCYEYAPCRASKRLSPFLYRVDCRDCLDWVERTYRTNRVPK